MFLDEVVITVQAGKGGDGRVSFRREKYIPRGGPDGGNGGRGGHIFLKADSNLNTLAGFRGKKVFRALAGAAGGGQLKAGKNGADLILLVPVGTLVRVQQGGRQEKVLADLKRVGEQFCVARGGLGGKGNANFVSSLRQAPRFAEQGEPGECLKVKLELRLLADIGIIGLPSVGKSTLIARVSNVKPKIAAYHFTTLVPNLGVVVHKQRSFVVSDLPGLIAGASRGRGLGQRFLRHAERVAFFWHLIEGTSRTPLTDFRTLTRELKRFNPELVLKPRVIVFSKVDLISQAEFARLKAKFQGLSERIFALSAVTQVGVTELLDYTLEVLQRVRLGSAKSPVLRVFRPHLEGKVQNFRVFKRGKDLFEIQGRRVEQIVLMSDLANVEARARVQAVLRKVGIARELRRLGARPGVLLKVGQRSFKWAG